MKKLYISFIFSFIALCLCAQDFTGDVEITCQTLEERGEMLFMDLDFHIRREAIGKCQSWTLIPQLVSSPEEMVSFPGILINGNNKRQMYERKSKYKSISLASKEYYKVVNVKSHTDTTIRYVAEIPYELWMDDAKLVVREILSSCGNQEQLITVSIGRKVSLEEREPYKVQPKVAFIIPEKELVKNRNIQAQAYLDFQAGRSAIVPGFRRNPEELAKIRDVLRDIQNNQDVSITGMFIEGYASPEGSYALNERLSAERAEALRNYVAMNFGISRGLIKASSSAEDWDGLRILVEESDIPNREAILNTINSDMAPDEKEAHLKTMSSYRILLNEMFPALRRSDYRIDFTVRDYSVSESKTVLDKDPSLLSLYELYTLADSYEIGSADYNKVMDIMGRLYPDDLSVKINTATAMYLRGENIAAKNRLEQITEINKEAVNTLGVIYLIEGNLDKAETLLRKAQVLGSEEAEHNLEELNKKREDNVKMERYANR